MHISPHITLVNVYFIPEFKINLISVSCLIQSSNLSLIFLPNKCLLQDLKTKQVVGEAYQQGNLYQLPSSQMSYSIATATPKIWHNRLGHVSDPVLKHLDLPTQNNCRPCDSCHLAKQQRLPFSKNTGSAMFSFQLLHIDLWGPYKIPSLSNAHYFLTIVDDHTRTT